MSNTHSHSAIMRSSTDLPEHGFEENTLHDVSQKSQSVLCYYRPTYHNYFTLQPPKKTYSRPVFYNVAYKIQYTLCWASTVGTFDPLHSCAGHQVLCAMGVHAVAHVPAEHLTHVLSPCKGTRRRSTAFSGHGFLRLDFSKVCQKRLDC